MRDDLEGGGQSADYLSVQLHEHSIRGADLHPSALKEFELAPRQWVFEVSPGEAPPAWVRVDAELPESSFANRSGFKPPALLLKCDEVENLTQLLVEVGNGVGVRGSSIANQLLDRQHHTRETGQDGKPPFH